MKLLINILFLFLSLRCFAQQETKEHFLNAIEHSIQQNCNSGYYLDKRAGRISLNEDARSSTLKRYVPNSIANELLNSASNDTITTEWQFDKLNKAHLVPDSNKKTLSLYGHKWRYISRPIFDNHTNYAIIKIVETSGRCHFYSMSVFIRKSGRWVKRADIERGVYCTGGSNILESSDIEPLPIIR